MTQSQRIPIAQGDAGMIEEEAELYHHAMIADYKDYVFYSRIVEGMRRQQGHTRDIALRYENQALIDHIVRTRHNRGKAQQLSQSPISVRNFGDIRSTQAPAGLRLLRNRINPMISNANAIEALRLSSDDSESDDEDELIFDMEL